MPSYDYKCQKCEKVEEKTHSIKEDPVFNCSGCGTQMEKIFSPNIGGFTFGKMGTLVIHQREKDLRKQRSVRMAEKQKNSKRFVSKVLPNVGGVETTNWADAQKLAKEKGKDTNSYTPFVEKEKKGQLITNP
jgi:putative FmdB family regulatory protein